MIQKLLVVFFCLMMLPKGISQIEVPEFSYIIVPEKFDFLKGKDTYQLNSLTKFLLKKNGFKAAFSSELSSIDPCNVLWADLEVDDGLIYTKMSLILTDCNGAEVARSKQGKSKQKDYKKAHQEAVRVALDGFNTGYLTMTPLEMKEESVAVEPKTIELNIVPKTVAAAAIVAPKQALVTKVVVSVPIESPPPIPITYSFEAYTIIPINPGAAILYQGERIGVLIPTATPSLFLVRSSKFYGIAHKTADGFIIEREVEGMNSLLTMKFE
ncbi:MAG: hypothetical protein ACI86C_000806 [Candidatus Latescibacterota bacterium]